MKTLPQITALAAKDTSSARVPLKVCMHVLGTAGADGRVKDARVMREATALLEAGFEVVVVDVADERNWPGEENIRGARIKHITMPGWSMATRFKPWFLVKTVQMTLRGTIQLLSVPADIYHAHDANALPACYIAACLRRKPLIFDSHEIPFDDPNITRWLGSLARRVLARMLPRCAGVITASPLYAREIRNQYHYPEVTVVNNLPTYRAVPRSDRLRQFLGLRPNVRIALYQGNIQPNRGLEMLVHAAPFLAPDVVIVLMGSAVETTRIQLESLIASKGVAHRVKIIPAVPYEELLDWTASADIGLAIFSPDYTPSIRFCLPNKLFEYLMAGLPVLTSLLDAIVEVIKTYDVGQIVPSLTPSDIGAAINAMLADTPALARMRSNALEAARQEFHWENESQKLIQLYDAVLTTPPVRVCMHVLESARADVRVIRAATALVQTNYAVSVVDIENERNQHREEDIDGVCVKHIIVSRSFLSTRFDRWVLMRSAQLFIRCVVRLIRTPADIYHAHDVSALPTCYIAACLRRKPLIFEAHELPLYERPLSELGRVRRWLHKLLAVLLDHIVPRCAGVITVSPPIVEAIRKRYHVPEVTLIRNVPVYQAVQRSDRLRQYLGLNPEVRIALYQGNLQANRGLDKLVYAAAFLERDIVIVMMGENIGNTVSQLEALVAGEGLADRVKILPPVPYAELLDWTASADIGLNVASPDYSLNVRYFLPNKLFEYLMAGLPVLTSSLEVIVDVINTYDVGQVLSSLAPADIGGAINRMLADPVGLARQRSNALEAARNEFYWEKESLRLIHLYQGILQGRLRRKSSAKNSTSSN